MTRQIAKFENLKEVAEWLKDSIDRKLGDRTGTHRITLSGVYFDEKHENYEDDTSFIGYRRCFDFENRQIVIEPKFVSGRIVVGEPSRLTNSVEFRYQEDKLGIRKRVKIAPTNAETIIRTLDGRINFYLDELQVVAERMTGRILGG